MGRICKRVPLDFSWPMKTIWIGYVNPYNGVKCPYCDAGYSKEAQKIRDEVYRHNHDDRYLPNPYHTGWRYNPKQKVYNMGQDEIDYIMSNKFNDEQRKNVMEYMVKPQYPDAKKITPEIFSYLALINPMFPTCNLDWELINYHSEKEGWDSRCPHCGGDGILYLNDEIKRLHEDFRWQEPPTGEGYQIWENTSEGSPITPVFKTAEELAEYCEREGVSWYAHETASKEDWLQLINGCTIASKEIASGVIVI